MCPESSLGMGVSVELHFQVRQSQAESPPKVMRKHVPQRVVLGLHIKFYPQSTPYISIAGSQPLLEKSDSCPGTASFSPEPFLLLSVKWEEKALLLPKALLDPQEEAKINV